MPRKAKEENKEIEEKVVKKAPKSKKNSEETLAVSKVENKKATATKKTTASKKTTPKKETKKSTSTASKVKKETAKKETVKKSTTSKKVATKATAKKETKTRKPRTTKPKVEVLEYYDLPYRYNQTVVKVLAQTPNTLFVYWDISDEDKKQYIEQYGEYFFNNTKPVLVVHNKTKNYDFEIDINDFANSWYLNITDSNCEYEIELGRRPINKYVTISNNYLNIANSNNMNVPNDHILFDKLSHFVYFRNVKTNETIKKHTNLTLLSKVGKIVSIAEFYKKLYPEEAINFDRLDLRNPSSNNPTSSFK